MKRSRKNRAAQTLFWVISLLVLVSMLCGMVLVVLPGPQRRVRPATPALQPTATGVLPTSPPGLPTTTPTATVAVAPSPLPKPTP